MAVDTIRKGIGELEAGERLGPGRVRRPGGGRKPLSESDPTILDDLERLVDEDRAVIPSRCCGGRRRVCGRSLAGCARWATDATTSVAELLRLLGYACRRT